MGFKLVPPSRLPTLENWGLKFPTAPHPTKNCIINSMMCMPETICISRTIIITWSSGLVYKLVLLFTLSPCLLPNNYAYNNRMATLHTVLMNIISPPRSACKVFGKFVQTVCCNLQVILPYGNYFRHNRTFFTPPHTNVKVFGPMNQHSLFVFVYIRTVPCSSSQPVSYTHLDVYKRQIYRWSELRYEHR